MKTIFFKFAFAAGLFAVTACGQKHDNNMDADHDNSAEMSERRGDDLIDTPQTNTVKPEDTMPGRKFPDNKMP